MKLAPPSRTAPDTVERSEVLARTHRLLAAGVPLSLLLDLASPRGPRSEELFSAEEPDLDWLDRLGR